MNRIRRGASSPRPSPSKEAREKASADTNACVSERDDGVPCRGARGFTLIEIMMVVAIMGLTLSMGIPAFVRVLKKEGMRKAESDLVEACQDARRDAIMNNKTADLVLHPIDGSFEVPGSFERKSFPDDIVIDILGVNFIQFERADEARVHFFPNGTSDEFTIVIRSTTDGAIRQISLDTVTALTVVKTLR